MKFSKAVCIYLLMIIVYSVVCADQSEPIILDKRNMVTYRYSDKEFYKYLSRDNADVVLVYLEAGYDVNSRNQASQTPLMVAAQKGCFNVADLLIRRGADVNATDCDSCTALMYAASKRRATIATMLIEHKADVNRQNKNGWTALMFAIDSGSCNTIDELITIDTDPMLRNKDNQTARDFAIKHRFDKLPQYIKDKIEYLQATQIKEKSKDKTKEKSKEKPKRIFKPKLF